MNRRQRKKAFKKKYGMNPAEALRVGSDVLRWLPEAIEQTLKAVDEIMDWLREALPSVMENVSHVIERTLNERVIEGAGCCGEQLEEGARCEEGCGSVSGASGVGHPAEGQDSEWREG